MPPATLYKYRSLGNWQFVIDILLNERVYAAPFPMLNDPMEGRLIYFQDDIAAHYRRATRRTKNTLRICSLSATKLNTLLWSYYAEGHAGVAFGLRVRPGQRGVVAGPTLVRYDSRIVISKESARTLKPQELARLILEQKQEAWQHEQEHRVFSTSAFVEVEIRELVLGCNVSEQDELILRKLVSKLRPRARVLRLSRGDLDGGRA